MSFIRKKILIKSLAIISFLSISLFAFINTNEYKILTKSSLDGEVNKKELNNKNLEHTNNEKNLNRNINDGLIFPQYNRAIYNNRFTQPIISIDPNNPGFMGVPQAETDETFHNQISWNGENLITQWSYDITKHPDIVKLKEESSGVDFRIPIIIGGIHSDNGKTNNFRNQIILIIGDQRNLDNKKFAIIRYDTISGVPIVNNIPISFTMVNLLEPVASSVSELTITYDQYNDRYIVYYPGLMKKVASDMKSLKIDSSNQLNLENNPFSGISNWPSNADGSKPLFNENNYILAIKAVPQTRDGSGNLGMIIHNANFSNDLGTFANSISMLELKSNLSPIDGWMIDKNQMKIAKSDSNNYQENLTNSIGEIIVERNSYWKYFNPYMAIDIIDENTYTSSIILPVTKGTNAYSMRLVFIRKNKFFDNKNSNELPLSNVNFNNSIIPTEQQKIYNVWYNEKKPLECIITINSRSINEFALSIKYVFPKSNFTEINNSKPINLEIREASFSANSNFRTMVSIESYNHQNLYYTSLSDRKIFLNLTKLSNENAWINNNIIILELGGFTPLNPFDNANRLNWLNGQSAQKTPSEILINDLFANNKTLTNNNLFSRNYLLSLVDKSETITDSTNFSNGIVTILDNTMKNDASGIISGDIQVNFSFDTPNFDPITLSSKMPFSVSGFHRQNTNTELIAKNQETLNNTLPSDITSSNVTDFFTLNNLPLSVTPSQLTWNFINADNKTGSITIEITTPKWYKNGVEQNTLEKFSKEFFLKNIPGTQMVRNSISIANLTVWDINANNIGRYLNFANTIPGSSILATYIISAQNGLEGTLDVTARITGGYYDPNNNALPNPNPNSTTNSITLKITISGFSKIIGQTSIEALTGNSEISPSNFLDNPSALLDYVRIISQVPESMVTIENIRPRDDLGSLTANFIINKTYNTNGTINNSPKTFSDIQFENFKIGDGIKTSKIVQINNLSQSSLLFPEEVNKSNISSLTKLFYIPTGAEVTYSFSNKNNISTITNGGTLDVTTFIKPGIENGISKPEGVSSTITLTGLKSVKGETKVIDKIGNPNLYPQFVLTEDISNMIAIENGSQIFNKITQINILKDSLIYDNILGKITIFYQMSNYFESDGSFSATTTINPKKISIFGFKTISGPTTLILKENASVSNIVPKDFDETKWNDYFKITNTLENTNLEKITIEKIGFDDSKGIVTLKISNILNYINSDNRIIYDQPGEFIVNLSGFKIVENNTMLFLIIGSSIGGLILLLIISLSIVYLINKNKKTINEKNIRLVSKNDLKAPNKNPRTFNTPIAPSVHSQNLPPKKIVKNLNEKNIPKIPPKK